MTGLSIFLFILIFALLALAGFFAYNAFFKKKLEKYQIEDKVFLEIKIVKSVTDVKDNVQSDPLAAEQLFSVIHGILKQGGSESVFSFEIIVSDEKIRFIVVVPRILQSHITSQIYAQYPLSQITVVEDYLKDVKSYSSIKTGSLVLGKNDVIPILTFKDFEVDPLSAITSSLSQVKANEGMAIQLLVKPIPDTWQIKGYDYIAKIKKKETGQKGQSIAGMVIVGLIDVLILNPIKYILGIQSTQVEDKKQPQITALSQSEEGLIKSIDMKLTRMGFKSYIRVISYANETFDTEQNYNSCMATFKQFSRANLNGFVELKTLNKDEFIDNYLDRRFDAVSSYVLNTEELATIYHLPSSSVENPNIDWAPIKISDIPDNLPTKECVRLAKARYRSKIIEYGLKDGNDRLRHMYMIGKTGSGKSSLFQTMIIQDILKGNGVGVVDPHGELINAILDYIPEDRIEDVVLIDPADIEFPVGINIMELEPGDNVDRNASEIVNAFKSIFKDSWGPRLEYILRNTINAMLQVPGTTILGVKRLLTDDDYRKFILSALTDVAIKDYFEREFAAFKANPKLVTESISPIQNKIGPFETIKIVRNILCQKNSTIKFNELMNQKKIVLINLSKGLVGEDVMNLFGSLIISKIQAAILARASIPMEERSPFYLYIDEFQNFTTDTFMSILSESRKYGLGLYLTHQYVNQLSEEIKYAIRGNVGTTVTFGLGPTDALSMKEVFAPYFNEMDIQSLPRFHVINNIMIDGSVTKPFIGEIILPWETFEKTGNAQKCRDASRRKYGTERLKVEALVEQWIVKKFKGLNYQDIAKKQ